MKTLSSQADDPSDLENLFSKACFEGERIVLERENGTRAAIVPIEDLDVLEAIETDEFSRLVQKMVDLGVEQLSFAELLAIALGEPSPGESNLALAEDLCSCFGSPEKLIEASKEEILQVEGVREDQFEFVQAAFELFLDSNNNPSKVE